MPKLIFYQQQKKLFEYRLQSGRIWVGRSDGCDLSLNGKGISRRHCSLLHQACPHSEPRFLLQPTPPGADPCWMTMIALSE